jgi:cytochrome c oxidase assembly protein subunit 15
MRSVKKWVLATFILTFFVIIAGGVVRTTQSGMGCPDWPTCFGKWIPPTNASELPPDFEKYLKTQDIDHTFNVYHTWIEYFNRLAGVLLGVFAIIQLFLLYFKRKEQKKSYRLALAFLATVILTGLFGAVVVKLNLAHASISIHLLFAVVLTQLQLALFMSVRSGLSYLPVQKNIRRIVVGLLIVILIQSILGTMVRIYVDDVSKVLHYEQRETWLADSPVAFLIHRSFSWVVLLLTAFIAWYCRNESAVRKNIYYLTANIILSMVTGIVLYKLDMPAIAQPLHLLLATIAVTQSVYILLKTKSAKI